MSPPYDDSIVAHSTAACQPVQLELPLGAIRRLNRWQLAGLPVVPFWHGSKAAIFDDYLERDPLAQWAEASGTVDDVNMGLRLERVSCVDCDSRETSRRLDNYLGCLGLAPPAIRTASPGHVSYYIHVEGEPADVGRRKLSPGLTGDYLAAGAALVPRSVIRGRNYAFMRGNERAIAAAPLVQWADIRSLVNYVPRPLVSYDHPPVPLLRRDVPGWVYPLLERLAGAAAGWSVDDYATRSEAEYAAICSLILSGRGLPEVLAAFDTCKPGHYMDYKTDRARKRYLTHSYHKALDWVCGLREEWAEAFASASVAAWPGRTGMHDRSVYLAVLALCWLGASWDTFAAVRDLEMLAAKDRLRVLSAIERLGEAGLITRVGVHGGGAAIYRVGCVTIPKNTVLGEPGGLEKFPPQGGLKPGQPGTRVGNDTTSAELARIIGRSALAVFALLSGEPVTIPRLARQLGKHRTTAWRAVRRLEAFGLAAVEVDGVRLGEAAIRDVALEVGASVAARRRALKVAAERRAWRNRRREASGGL